MDGSFALGNLCFNRLRLKQWFFCSLSAVYAESETKETLNKSSAAEQRIFSSIRSVSKVGNTSSIPPLLKLSAEEKSLAVSTCRFIQSFPKFAHLASAEFHIAKQYFTAEGNFVCPQGQIYLKKMHKIKIKYKKKVPESFDSRTF